MNSNDKSTQRLTLLEIQIEAKIQKLELLISQLNSLFNRIDELEKKVNEFNNLTTVKKQDVVYLSKDGKVKTLHKDK